MRSGMRAVSLVILLFSSLSGYCQEAKLDTSFLARSQKQLVNQYTTYIANQSRLYNGSDYIYYISTKEEHPYYGIDDWSYGSIVYWDELYENVALLYDLSIDQVITEHNRGNPIKLIGEKVQSFTLMGHTFVRLTRDEKNKIPEGFYDRLYEGKSKVFAKYSKVYEESIDSRVIIPRFDATTRYYIVKNGIFHNVKSKKSVLSLFEDHKQEVKAFFRKSNMRFKDDRTTAIVRMTEYYDTLTD